VNPLGSADVNPKPLLFLLLLSLVPCIRSAEADEEKKRTAEGIQDNSFFIEEAYNQEEGVVQHIMNVIQTVDRKAGPDDRELSFVFTQEWPAFSQTHQLSYTLPYTFIDSGGHSENGIEDISLNYRFQALMESKTTPAFAPRFSLILPTGDADKGLGDDTVGYQLGLPVSKIVSDRWTLHGNAGATLLPDVSGHDLVNYSLGASAVYAVSRNFNLMLESVATWDEEVNDAGRTQRDVSVIISPGVRYAFNHPNDAQTVIGIAAPIGVTAAAPDFGVFLYASFEHFFFRPKAKSAEK
jgi:Putative MetA-pathway of phenol degradation